MYDEIEDDEVAPTTKIIDGAGDAEDESPRPKTTIVRKDVDDEDEDDEIEKAAAGKAADDDTEVERTKLTPRKTVAENNDSAPVRKTIVHDGSQVSVPDRRKIIRRKISTARRVSRGPVVVSGTTIARKRDRPVKRT